MNSRERVLAVVNRQKPDRIPKDLSYGLCPAKEAELKERTGSDNYWDYFDLDIRFLNFAPTKRVWDPSVYFADKDSSSGFSIDEWGVGIEKSINNDLHFERLISPLKGDMDEKTAEEYPLPDYLEDYRHEHFKQTVSEYHARGLAVCGLLSQTIFEKAWAIRGFEQTFMDMMDESEAICILFDRITKLRIEQAKLMIEAGIDVLMLGDDIGMQTGLMMSANLWREQLKPLLAEVIRAAKEMRPDLAIFYHSCGNVMEIVPDLIEVGVTVLNPLQPECMDLEYVKEAYGDKLAFWGGLSAQTNLSFGTTQQVKDEVKERIKVLGHNGGYLIGPNHVVEPEVPWENLIAFFEAIDEFGVYS